MAVCTKCGTGVPDEARFCPSCGSPIVQAEAPAPAPEPAVEPASVVQDQVVTGEYVQSQEQAEAPVMQPVAPQQSYYAQPQQQQPQQQSYYAQPQQQPAQQSYYAQPQQQSYYAQPQQQQPQQQNYYAQPQQQPQQQSYYSQPGQQQPQQNYYAPQNQQQPPNYGYQQNYQQPPSYQTGPADIEENKGISVLCYLGILLLIPLLSKPNSGFVRYHSNQGLVLLIFEILVGILGMIPYLGWFIIWPVGYIFGLVCIIMGIVNAVNGNLKPLPLIGKITLLK